jgi:hypothetical protein
VLTVLNGSRLKALSDNQVAEGVEQSRVTVERPGFGGVQTGARSCSRMQLSRWKMSCKLKHRTQQGWSTSIKRQSSATASQRPASSFSSYDTSWVRKDLVPVPPVYSSPQMTRVHLVEISPKLLVKLQLHPPLHMTRAHLVKSLRLYRMSIRTDPAKTPFPFSAQPSSSRGPRSIWRIGSDLQLQRR